MLRPTSSVLEPLAALRQLQMSQSIKRVILAAQSPHLRPRTAATYFPSFLWVEACSYQVSIGSAYSHSSYHTESDGETASTQRGQGTMTPRGHDDDDEDDEGTETLQGSEYHEYDQGDDDTRSETSTYQPDRVERFRRTCVSFFSSSPDLA